MHNWLKIFVILWMCLFFGRWGLYDLLDISKLKRIIRWVGKQSAVLFLHFSVLKLSLLELVDDFEGLVVEHLDDGFV